VGCISKKRDLSVLTEKRLVVVVNSESFGEYTNIQKLKENVIRHSSPHTVSAYVFAMYYGLKGNYVTM
jgi:hypothetical protein